MNKALTFLLGAGILAGIAGTGWTFFQSSMACHPLARACWQAVGEATGEAEAIAMAEASFANDPREGARILIAFGDQGRKAACGLPAQAGSRGARDAPRRQSF